MLDLINTVARQVRQEMVEKYPMLYGRCIEASERIQAILLEKGIPAVTVEGWCRYDDATGCSDAPWDAHTWVEVEDLYIDVTADQFQAYMEDPIPGVIVGEKPYYMTYAEPEVEEY